MLVEESGLVGGLGVVLPERIHNFYIKINFVATRKLRIS